ncbi:FRG domain-containing protein [Paenibacillus sp. FSL K6-1318]|uniref:FRG domain-containing protein n=1 Tax=Paenibacillus sp. FSL K6-1318 TaxID=2975291 RepID=UPI0030EBB371
MKEIHIKNFNELHNVFSNYRKNNLWLFRGHSNVSWELIPKAGREPYCHIDDKRFFESWKRRAVEFIDLHTENEWDWLAVAQHHGLATRLLDWTFNPLIAAYFAVENYEESDAIIYAYLFNRSIETNIVKTFEYEGIGRVKPNGRIQRIVRQGGIFTIHNPPTTKLDDNITGEMRLDKIIIDKSYRQELRFELSHYGYNRLTLYSDLDGLSSHANWYMENRNYWNGEEIDFLE